MIDEKRGQILFGSGLALRLPATGAKVEAPRRFAQGPPDAPMSIALDSDAGLLYVGTSTGHIRAWRFEK